jgi:hypothetical protein
LKGRQSQQIGYQIFQVTAVGADMEEAQWMQHKVRQALLGFTPTVTGWATGPISAEQPRGVTRDDDGPVFITTDDFRIFVSPS